MAINILLVGENIDKFLLYLSRNYDLKKADENVIVNQVEITTFTMNTNLVPFCINLIKVNKSLLNFEIKRVYNIVDSILVLNEFKPRWVNSWNVFTIVREYGSIDDILECIYNKLYIRPLEVYPPMSEMGRLTDAMSRLYI